MSGDPMASRPERLKAVVRWDSQETIVTSSDTVFSDADAKTVVDEQDVISGGDGPLGAEKASQETIVRNGDAPFDPEALDIDIEKLGRQRPACLPTALRELAFCFSILISMVMSVSIPTPFPSPLPRAPLALLPTV